ncbi:MAG: ankyrin repeat domain-containing protein [Candidatus Wallbacteria bacterium]|nr:ankyrin repeat domain-containing protein [Candidatus Wallbacteria bacterium]
MYHSFIGCVFDFILGPFLLPLFLLLITSPFWFSDNEEKSIKFISSYAFTKLSTLSLNLIGFVILIILVLVRIFFAQPIKVNDDSRLRKEAMEQGSMSHSNFINLKDTKENIDIATKKLFFAQSSEEVIGLINQGANVNAEEESGYTPLMFAILNRNKGVVESLVRNGADVKHKKWNLETILSTLFFDSGAVLNIYGIRDLPKGMDYDLLDFLIKSGADIDSLFRDDCRSTNSNFIKICKKYNAKGSQYIHVLDDGHGNKTIQQLTVFAYLMLSPLLFFLNFVRAVWLDINGKNFMKQLLLSCLILIALMLFSPVYDFMNYSVLIVGFRDLGGSGDFGDILGVFIISLAFLMPNFLMMLILANNCSKISFTHLKILKEYSSIPITRGLFFILFIVSVYAFRYYMWEVTINRMIY